jgi:hypothetical protein
MDCQSGAQFKVLHSLIFCQRKDGHGVPCLGHCLNVGISGKPMHAQIVVVRLNDAVLLFGPSGALRRKSMRTKRI